jgi:hypothetical protein
MIKKRRLILGGDPDEKFGVPDEKAFDLGGEFLDAQGCDKIAEALIKDRKCFESLREATIIYLWKKKGSEKPKMVLGKCQRPSGLLGHFSGADFIIWFAANNCRGITRWQMEALIFHELKHARKEDGEAVTVPHDWEGFAEEIERYGLWKRDIQPIAAAISGALLIPFDEPKAEEKESESKEPPPATTQVH